MVRPDVNDNAKGNPYMTHGSAMDVGNVCGPYPNMAMDCSANAMTGKSKRNPIKKKIYVL